MKTHKCKKRRQLFGKPKCSKWVFGGQIQLFRIKMQHINLINHFYVLKDYIPLKKAYENP
jgi:hypothetical protein